MELYKSWLKYQPPGATNYFIAEVIDAFTQGKVFAAWQWVATGATMIPASLKGKVMVVPPPGFKKPAATLNRNYIIGGQPWVINAFNDPEHMQVADGLHEMVVPAGDLARLSEARRHAVRQGDMLGGRTSTASIRGTAPTSTCCCVARTSGTIRNTPKCCPIMQEAITGYYTGQIKDPLHALKWVACQQQKILYRRGHRQRRQPRLSAAGYRL